jgi:MerR family transcriptional regulator, heat shock protein HspR
MDLQHTHDLYQLMQICYTIDDRSKQASGRDGLAEKDTAVYAISVAAGMASMEIQNLRVYERHGLLSPSRTPGGTRLYSAEDVARLVRIGELLADGLNLAGIARVLELEESVARLQATNARLRDR